MTDLTAEQKAAYLVDPRDCPCCRSFDTEGCDADEYDTEWHEADWFSRAVCCWCNHCKAEWREKYTLTDITLTRKPAE